MKKQSGFTLIELLVVIAIIGILSSIVIASLNSARNKGKDSAVKAALKQISTQAENYYDTNNTFTPSATCGLTATNPPTIVTASTTGVFADPVIQNQLVYIGSYDAPTSSVVCRVDSTGQRWAVSISGLSNVASSYCIDNSGNNTTGKTASTTGVCL
jgi:prepilin-type N-terminal cleavage/methylation domain-containing protein